MTLDFALEVAKYPKTPKLPTLGISVTKVDWYAQKSVRTYSAA